MKGTIEVLTNASKAIAIANFNAGGAVQMLGIQYLRVDLNPGSEKFGRPTYQNDFGRGGGGFIRSQRYYRGSLRLSQGASLQTDESRAAPLFPVEG